MDRETSCSGGCPRRIIDAARELRGRRCRRRIDNRARASTTIDATALEFQFEPNSWTVAAGEPFTIQFENAGSVEHEWAVIRLGEDSSPRPTSQKRESCSRSRRFPLVSPRPRSSLSMRRGPIR